MEFDKHVYKKHRVAHHYEYYFNKFTLINFLYWSLRRLLKLINILIHSRLLQLVCKILPAISYASLYFNFMHNLIAQSVLSKRSLHSKIFNIALLVLGIPLSILSFIFSNRIISVMSTALSIINHLWDCGTVIASKTFGSLSVNPAAQLQRKANEKLFESIHKIIIQSIFLTGIILSLHPASFYIGTIILLAMTVYTISDRIKLNQLRWLANHLFCHDVDSNANRTKTNTCVKLHNQRQGQLTSSTTPYGKNQTASHKKTNRYHQPYSTIWTLNKALNSKSKTTRRDNNKLARPRVTNDRIHTRKYYKFFCNDRAYEDNRQTRHQEEKGTSNVYQLNI